MAIFRFSKMAAAAILEMAAAAILDFQNFKFSTVGQLKRVEVRCVVTPNLVEISQNAAEI